ncbi:MAG TPA: hypothetical protein VNY05_36895 [Candidatus Acidoferrales bacterium]|nr:hypothetical protein [Candidatus Acidoferrales bacterium]
MTLDERLEALTHTVELMAGMQTHAAEESEERFLRLDERLLEFAERHDREIAEIRRELGRAIRLSIQETRNERKRRQEMAADAAKRHEEAAKRHQELEDMLKAFLERGGNGKH